MCTYTLEFTRVYRNTILIDYVYLSKMFFDENKAQNIIKINNNYLLFLLFIIVIVWFFIFNYNIESLTIKNILENNILKKLLGW